MKKVCVLALDGLEFNLVEEFDLRNLKQIEYGRTSLEEFEIAFTPIIWSSFITGLPPEKHKDEFKHGIRLMKLNPRTWKNPLVNRIRRVLPYSLRENVGEKIINPFLNALIPEELLYRLFSEKKVPTIFDEIKNSFVNEMPAFTWEHGKEERLLLKNAFKNETHRKELEEYMYEKLKREREKLVQALKKGYKLIVWYTNIADFMGHLMFGDLAKMSECYLKLDGVAKDASKMLNKDDLLIITSDHGMKPFGKTGFYGLHSEYGFYSINHKLKLKNPKVTEFFDIIKNYLKSNAIGK